MKLRFVPLMVAITFFACRSAEAQSPQYCHSLFEQGRDADRVANDMSRRWLRQQDKYFESLARAESEIQTMAGKPESPEVYATVRGKLRGLRETLEVIIDDGAAVEESVDEVLSLLDDLDTNCGVHPSIENWYDAKIDILDKLSNKVERSISTLRTHSAKLEEAEANPAKVLRRAMTLPKAGTY